eukprot:3285878-Rhodomonas_salina.1
MEVALQTEGVHHSLWRIIPAESAKRDGEKVRPASSFFCAMAAKLASKSPSIHGAAQSNCPSVLTRAVRRCASRRRCGSKTSKSGAHTSPPTPQVAGRPAASLTRAQHQESFARARSGAPSRAAHDFKAIFPSADQVRAGVLCAAATNEWGKRGERTHNTRGEREDVKGKDRDHQAECLLRKEEGSGAGLRAALREGEEAQSSGCA